MTLLNSRSRLLVPTVAALACAALLTGCTPDTGGVTADATTSSAPTSTHSATPRLALTHEGGVLVLDARTLTVVGELEIGGYNRISPAGDERHVIVSTAGGFRILDTGAWSRSHGDHSHHYTAAPALTDVTFDAEDPGHVVRHAGRTLLFDDGTGRVRSFDPAQLGDGPPQTEAFTVARAHHGIAVELADGRTITTLGDARARTGIVVHDAAHNEVARNEHCPGIHGETVAAGEAVVFGCENGLLIHRGDAITEVASPDPYGRIGNLAGTESSAIVLGDYKSNPNAELERPQRVSLTNTETGELRLVDLGTSYTFRSLGRGPLDEALILGTDGALHVLDPASATVTRRIPVLAPWTEPDEWQSPRPALYVQDGTAYVTDPAGSRVHAVDLETGELTSGPELTHVPDEITGVRG